MTIKYPNRRQFVKVAVGSLASIPLIVSAQAESEKLSEGDPTALALGYKENTADVDVTKHPKHSKAQICGGCSLYTGGANAWGGCAIFPGKQVAAAGWCAAYAAKPS